MNSEKTFLLKLPTEQHKALKLEAAKRETSMKALIADGIRQVINQPPNQTANA